MTDVPSPEMRALIGDEPRRHPATAHLPIPGCGRWCGGCDHLLPVARKNVDRGRCVKYLEFRHLAYRAADAYRAAHDDWWRGLPTISANTAACKYYERSAAGADAEPARHPAAAHDHGLSSLNLGAREEPLRAPHFSEGER